MTDPIIAANYLLPRRQLEALEEIARHQGAGRQYWWRQASMRKLCERGFVRVQPGWEMYSRPPWQITDAGREHLKGFPKNDD